MLATEFPRITSELGVGLGPYGSMTPYDSTKVNNNCPNVPGGVYFVPLPAGSGQQPAGQTTNKLSTPGYGSGLWIKQVLYKSTANAAVQAGPAAVYYADETFTTVTSTASEAFIASKAVMGAGWLLPNAGTVTGMGAGTTNFTATLLNNGGSGSWVWIGVQGFIPSCYLNTGAANNFLYAGESSAWTVGAVADGSAINFKVIGYCLTLSGTIGDVLAIGPIF